MASTPSFVFSYLPAAAKATVNDSANSLASQASAFFQSASKAFTAPKLTSEQAQLLTLQQTKQHFEDHAALKAKAGMSITEAEKAQFKTVEKAIAGLGH